MHLAPHVSTDKGYLQGEAKIFVYVHDCMEKEPLSPRIQEDTDVASWVPRRPYGSTERVCGRKIRKCHRTATEINLNFDKSENSVGTDDPEWSRRLLFEHGI